MWFHSYRLPLANDYSSSKWQFPTKGLSNEIALLVVPVEARSWKRPPGNPDLGKLCHNMVKRDKKLYLNPVQAHMIEPDRMRHPLNKIDS